MAKKTKETGIPYELIVRAIFQEIHDQQQVRTISVEHNVIVQGKLSRHQIDVRWLFELGGITYNTIVQAKNWGSRIKQEHVHTHSMTSLKTSPAKSRGVMVTRTGFQAGAKTLADKHGIKLYLLHEYTRTEPIQLLHFGYANCTVDPVALVLRVTVFKPEYHLTLVCQAST